MSDISDKSDSDLSRSPSASSSYNSEDSVWSDDEELDDVEMPSPSSSDEKSDSSEENGSIETQPAVDIYTIDYNQKPKPEKILESYKSVRQRFKTKKNERDKLEVNIQICKKNIDNLEMYSPSAAAVWINLTKLLRFLYRYGTSNKEPFPEMDVEVFGRLLNIHGTRDVQEKIDSNLKITEKMIEHLLYQQKSIILRLIPIAKGFFKEQFSNMVNNSSDLFTTLTGLTVDEILENEDIDADQLGKMMISLSKDLRRCVETSNGKNGKIIKSSIISTSPDYLTISLNQLAGITNTLEPLFLNGNDLNKWWSNYTQKVVEYEGEDMDSGSIKEYLNKDNALKELDKETEDVISEMGQLQRKQARINRLILQLRRDKMISDQGIDESGNKIVEIAQEDLDRMKEEVIQVEKDNEELATEIKRLREQRQNYGEEGKIDLGEDKEVTELEIQTSPDVVIQKTKMSQMALDVKIFKKECHRLSEYEQYCIGIEAEINDTIIKEETELENAILQAMTHDNEHAEKLAVEERELRNEINSLPAFPESEEEFMASVKKCKDNFQALKDKMARNSERNEKLDDSIDKDEKELMDYSSNFDKHIRVEFEDILIKNVEIKPTNLQQDDVDLIHALAEYNALNELRSIPELTDENIDKECETLLSENEQGFFILMKMKQTLTFLEQATPEEKRKFYTREAERRVRFTRHYLERVKELIKHSKDVHDLQSKSEEALGERYDLVQQWQDRVEDLAKKQEEKNANLFAEFLKKLPVLKGQESIRSKVLAEIDEEYNQVKIVEQQVETLDAEYDELAKIFEEVNNTKIEEKYTHSVGLQAEVNELTAEEMELDILIEQEEKRIKELTDAKEKDNYSERKLQKRLRHVEKDVLEIEHKLEERDKVEQYGSYEIMIQAETQRLKDILKCSNCLTREKSACITKCFHTFCLECIENLVRARNRKCPKCKIGFGQNDYRRIYLGDSEKLNPQ